MFDYFLNGSGDVADVSTVNILGATSGDTGAAAIHGLKGKNRLNLFILHPKNRISDVQYAQMTSVLDPNIVNIAVAGATFDDTQEMVKSCFNDPSFRYVNVCGMITIPIIEDCTIY